MTPEPPLGTLIFGHPKAAIRRRTCCLQGTPFATVQHTRKYAEADNMHFDGKTTE